MCAGSGMDRLNSVDIQYELNVAECFNVAEFNVIRFIWKSAAVPEITFGGYISCSKTLCWRDNLKG